MNYNFLIGLSIGIVVISILSFIYINTIPSDVIFVNESTDEILTFKEFQDKTNPIVLLMIGLSFVSLVMILLLKSSKRQVQENKL